jgi:hypothetical protein
VERNGSGRTFPDKSKNRETISVANVAVRNEVNHEIFQPSHTPTGTADADCRRVLQIDRDWALNLLQGLAAGDIKPRKYGKRTFITQDERKRFVENMPCGR